jgi:hypothetical protein
MVAEKNGTQLLLPERDLKTSKNQLTKKNEQGEREKNR